MPFSTDIKTIMTGDSSVNAWCTGGIHYENLPENWQLTKTWLVYSFNVNDEERCMSGSAYITNYNVVVKIVTTDTVLLERISDRLRDVLRGATSGNIRDMYFVTDDHTMDLEKRIYMNTLNFVALYS